MEISDLKQDLIKIEFFLKKGDLSSALKIYEKINKNWEDYKSSLDIKTAKELLNIVKFIETLLKQKRDSFFNTQKCLNLCKIYSKF